MNLKKAEEILGDRSIWELRNMKKALGTFQFLNTNEENIRLKAVDVVLRSRR